MRLGRLAPHSRHSRHLDFRGRQLRPAQSHAGIRYFSRPQTAEKGVEGRAEKWTYTQTDGDRPRVRVSADSFRQVKEPSLVELEGVRTPDLS